MYLSEIFLKFKEIEMLTTLILLLHILYMYQNYLTVPHKYAQF
jgi:hypothetical protein